MKRWLCTGLLCVVLLFCGSAIAYAEEAEFITEAQLQEQMEDSGALELPDRLPDDTREELSAIGVDGIDLDQLSKVSAATVITEILRNFTEKLPSILGVFFAMLAIMMIAAFVNSMKLSLGEQPAGGVINLVSILCIIGIVITPVISCIASAATVIGGGAYFMLGCIPVMVGFLIAGGQTASGTSFSGILLILCNGISFLASHCIVPVLHIFLGFSVVSCISPNLNFNGICKSFYTAVKWILGFGMTIFSGLLTMQGLLGGAVDVTTNKSLRFVVSSFVPVVGSALGEAMGTVHSCAKVLKSGVGAFGILAIVFIFLPILIQCVMWLLSLSIAAGIGDLFELKEVSGLLRAVSKVLSMLIAILLCCAVMLVISLEIVMMTGGNV